jgi:hypothetical protein
MSNTRRTATILILFITLLAAGGAAPTAQAGVSEAVLALAPPLAEQFGVPASSVTSLLEGGMSLDSVTELLLVSQKSEKGLDDVKKVYDETGSEISKTATQLDVAAADYSPEKVSAAIEEAKDKAQADAAAKTEAAANEATDKAAGAANDAVGSALGGLTR